MFPKRKICRWKNSSVYIRHKSSITNNNGNSEYKKIIKDYPISNSHGQLYFSNSSGPILISIHNGRFFLTNPSCSILLPSTFEEFYLSNAGGSVSFCNSNEQNFLLSLTPVKTKSFSFCAEKETTIHQKNNLSFDYHKSIPGSSQTFKHEYCQACLVKLNKNEFIQLVECSHSFCRKCLIETLKCSQDIDIKCPSESTCDAILREKDIDRILDKIDQNIFLIENNNNITSVEENEAISDFSDDINLNDQSFEVNNGFACGSTDCDGWCSFKEDNNDLVCICEICGNENCVFCQAVHVGLTCSQYWNEHDTNSGFQKQNEFLKSLEDEYNEEAISRQEFECPICMEIVSPPDGIMLYDCLHLFCKRCIHLTIEHCEEVQVKCPSDNCNSFLQDREVRDYSNNEIFRRYLNRSLLVAEKNSKERNFHCKKPDCQNFIYLDDDLNDKNFTCDVCNSVNCVPCQAIHTGITCQAYQIQELNQPTNLDDKATGQHLQNMVRQGKAMNCPKCNVMVMKDEGCDGLTCTFCKSDLCWATKGLRWGPRGKGDISAGCRCWVEGVPCTPNCQNCH